MISQVLQFTMLLAVLVYFILLINLLRRKSLNLKYTLLWIFSGLIMFILAVFPQILSAISELVGIYDPTNALFAIAFFCVIIILMSLTAIVSKLNEKIKRLVQAIALLEKRMRECEESKENK